MFFKKYDEEISLKQEIFNDTIRKSKFLRAICFIELLIITGLIIAVILK